MPQKKTVELSILDILNHPVPKTSTQIARELIDRGLYKSMYPNKLGSYISKSYLTWMVDSNYVILFRRGTPEWHDAKTLSTLFFKIKPRRSGSLYQTNFIYAFSGGEIKYLPPVSTNLNLAAMVFLHRLTKIKTENSPTNSLPKSNKDEISEMSMNRRELGINLLNFIYCGKFSGTRDKIRLELYKSKMDYSTIDLLEKLIDFGLNLPEIPFRPDVSKAIQFLGWISDISYEMTHKSENIISNDA